MSFDEKRFGQDDQATTEFIILANTLELAADAQKLWEEIEHNLDMAGIILRDSKDLLTHIEVRAAVDDQHEQRERIIKAVAWVNQALCEELSSDLA